MLDEGDQAIGHETAGPDGRSRSRDLADFHDAAGGDDLDAAARLCGRDLEGLSSLAGIDNGLDTITLHEPTLDPADPRGKTVQTGVSRRSRRFP